MDKLDTLKNKSIGQSAAKPRTGEGSETIPPKGSRGINPEIAKLTSCVYLIKDPSTSGIVYVGKTRNSLAKRYGEHLQDSKRKNTRISRYFMKRKREGNLPDMVPYICTNDLEQAEIEAIKHFKSVGAPLLNHTDGGEGVGGYNHSAEARKKISKALKGKPKSPEHLARMHALGKPVYLYNLDGEYTQQFDNIHTLSQHLNCHPSTVYYAMKRLGTVKGYQVRDSFYEVLDPIIRYYKPASKKI